jgi:hypothetical protein
MSDTEAEASVTEGFNPHATTTLDGVLITRNLVVWDYNLRLSVITEDKDMYRCPDYCAGDHWFDTTSGHYFNGSRMWVRHPISGQPAAEAYSGKVPE